MTPQQVVDKELLTNHLGLVNNESYAPAFTEVLTEPRWNSRSDAPAFSPDDSTTSTDAAREHLLPFAPGPRHADSWPTHRARARASRNRQLARRKTAAWERRNGGTAVCDQRVTNALVGQAIRGLCCPHLIMNEKASR